MKQLFELISTYPFVSIFLFIVIITIISEIKDIFKKY